LEGIGPHGGGVVGGVAEEPGRGEGARMERPRIPHELRESLRQVGRAQGEVRKPKCQRRHD
jgi:hypothetical protein